jgi:hypothetical protein
MQQRVHAHGGAGAIAMRTLQVLPDGGRVTVVGRPKPVTYRSVKINDALHHRIRVKAARDRVGVGALIESLLESALR